MARQLQEVLSSGELTEIRLGGATDPKLAIIAEVLEILLAEKQDQINASTPLDLLALVPDASVPAYQEGLVYYDQITKALSMYNDQVDMKHNLGQEEITRVYNGTASVIPNAIPVVIVPTVTNGFPHVVPTFAETFYSSAVTGITTHAIAPGSEGFITHSGTLEGDFSAFTAGNELFLADDELGGFTITPPPHATRLGIVLVAEVVGKMLVDINSNIVLPAPIGYMNLGQVPGTIGTAPTTINGFVNSGSFLMTVNPSIGTILIPYDGI